MTQPEKKAFTIIELLTVIAILALLMAILFPTLSKARQQAKMSACLSTLKGLGTGTTVYLNENRDTFYPVRLDTVVPSFDPRYRPFVNEFGRERPRWQWFIQTGSGPVIDPSKFKAMGLYPFGDDTGRGAIDTMSMTNNVFTCPSLDDPLYQKNIRDGAFGYNYQYLGNTRKDRRPDRWDNFAVGLHQLPAASSTVLIADSRGGGFRHGPQSFALDPPRLAVERNAQRFWPDVYDVQEANYQYSPAEPRHDGKANVVFVDAHAESMGLKKLGYELNDQAGKHPGFRGGDPIPVLTPTEEVFRATNKLWNGKGNDKMAKRVTGGP